MRVICHKISITIAIVFYFSQYMMSQGERIDVNLYQRGNDVSANLYGVFFEEINHSGDGGLYGELLENRSFEDTKVPKGWHVEAGHLVPRKVRHHFTGIVPERTFTWPKTDIPGWILQAEDGASAACRLTNENPYYESAPANIEVNITSASTPVRLVNDGFWGISLREKEKYKFRVIIKVEENYKGKVYIRLVDKSGRVLVSQQLKIKGHSVWNDLTGTLTSFSTVPDASFVVEFDSPGKIWLDYVSLFPCSTYKNRENGMRRDIAEAIADMNPTFLRWPGGSIVGGVTLDNRFEWKKTLGDPASRPGVFITWGEHCSYGFGYHEMLQLCEDMGMDAMFVCSAGMSDMFRGGEACPDDSIAYFVNECLDAIEYAIGGEDTEWGAKRIEAGHAKPFPLKYIEVGNEHYGKEYERRFNIFYNAIKAKYPQITVVSNHFIDGIGESVNTDVVAPHWYGTPNFYFNNTTLFDSIPREGKKSYIGEWACNYNVGKGNMGAALAEAAFLTGVERNADYVTMTSYAPLLQNRHDKDWNVNLIWYDSDSIVRRASYYVQCMAANNRPDYNIGVSHTGEPRPLQYKKGKIGFGSSKSPIEIKNIKITKDGTPVQVDVANGQSKHGDWTISSDGILTQKGTSGNSLYVLNGFEDNNYTLECNVKRGSFKEGVFLFFNITDDIHEAVRYNIGGWNCRMLTVNQLYDGLDVGAVGKSVQCSVLPDEWHHVKLVVTPDKSTLVLDGKEELSYTPYTTPEHFICAGVEESSGDLIMKVVNRTNQQYSPEIKISGLKNGLHKIVETTLSSDNVTMENSFGASDRIVPNTKRWNIKDNIFNHDFSPYSFTVLRIQTR